MLEFNINEHRYNHVYFIGIGGISMSAMAKLLIKNNYRVSGSDTKSSNITEILKKMGAAVYEEHSGKNLQDADLVIYTDAISMDNEELKQAIKNKIDIVDRANFLGAIMKNYRASIAVSGTHGKTSTTSMIAQITKNSKLDPTIMLGGELDEIDGNIRIGSENLFITEACEYRANILKYFPTTAIILNIDEDHLDFFDNIDHIISTFKQYILNLKEEDTLILNLDDKNTSKLYPIDNCKVVTIGIDNEADYMARDIDFDEESFPSFSLYYKDKFIKKMKLNVIGRHNIINSLAAIASTHENGMDFDEIIEELQKFKGVHRRLEFKGFYEGAKIVDDYAHHPTEIKSSIHALKDSCQNRLYTIFQPHTFTRTKLLLESFAKSFTESDFVIITDIYAAREKDYGDIHSKVLVDSIASTNRNVCYIERFEDIVTYLKHNLKEGDIAVTMGAGDVYKIGEMLLKRDTPN